MFITFFKQELILLKLPKILLFFALSVGCGILFLSEDGLGFFIFSSITFSPPHIVFSTYAFLFICLPFIVWVNSEIHFRDRQASFSEILYSTVVSGWKYNLLRVTNCCLISLMFFLLVFLFAWITEANVVDLSQYEDGWAFKYSMIFIAVPTIFFYCVVSFFLSLVSENRSGLFVGWFLIVTASLALINYVSSRFEKKLAAYLDILGVRTLTSDLFNIYQSNEIVTLQSLIESDASLNRLVLCLFSTILFLCTVNKRTLIRRPNF